MPATVSALPSSTNGLILVPAADSSKVPILLYLPAPAVRVIGNAAIVNGLVLGNIAPLLELCSTSTPCVISKALWDSSLNNKSPFAVAAPDMVAQYERLRAIDKAAKEHDQRSTAQSAGNSSHSPPDLSGMEPEEEKESDQKKNEVPKNE